MKSFSFRGGPTRNAGKTDTRLCGCSSGRRTSASRSGWRGHWRVVGEEYAWRRFFIAAKSKRRLVFCGSQTICKCDEPHRDDYCPSFRMAISPLLGWIDYRDENARAERKEHPEGVPSEEQACPMAFEFLRIFGIDRSQLATKGNTSELRTYKDFRRKSWFDTSQNKEIEEITSRGVFLSGALMELTSVEMDHEAAITSVSATPGRSLTSKSSGKV